MLRPSIFGESLFDDWMDDFPFGKEFEKEMFPEKSPLYGKHAKNMMKTDGLFGELIMTPLVCALILSSRASKSI